MKNFMEVMKRFNLDTGLPPIEKEIPFTTLSDAETAFLLAEKKYGVVHGDSLELPEEKPEEVSHADE